MCSPTSSSPGSRARIDQALEQYVGKNAVMPRMQGAVSGCPECRVQLVVAVFLFHDIPWISHICTYTCIAAKRRWGLTQWNQVTRGYPWGDFAEEKTKIVAKLAPKASGAPVREPRIDENTHKAHKLWCGRRVAAAMWGLWSGRNGHNDLQVESRYSPSLQYNRIDNLVRNMWEVGNFSKQNTLRPSMCSIHVLVCVGLKHAGDSRDWRALYLWDPFSVGLYGYCYWRSNFVKTWAWGLILVG